MFDGISGCFNLCHLKYTTHNSMYLSSGMNLFINENLTRHFNDGNYHNKLCSANVKICNKRQTLSSKTCIDCEGTKHKSNKSMSQVEEPKNRRFV